MPLTRSVRPVHYADTFVGTYIISVAAASVAETATYPLDLLKTRLQIQGEAANNNVGKNLVSIKSQT
jgi:solute carrier family 25 (mitochondrial uncoupling protein), member 27